MGRKDDVPGSGTDEDYLRRTGMTRAEYLEYMRNYNRRRNEREAAERRTGRAAFEEAERDRDEARGGIYKRWLRRYGNERQRAEGQHPSKPEPERVRRWWEGRGQHDRWVGADTPPQGERATPPDRPRRTGTSLGDLIGIPDAIRHEPSNPVSAAEQRRRADKRRRDQDPTNPENMGAKRRSDLADETDRNREARERIAKRERWHRENDPTNPENWGKRKGKGGGQPPPSGGLGFFKPAAPPAPKDDDNGDDEGGGLGFFKKV